VEDSVVIEVDTAAFCFISTTKLAVGGKIASLLDLRRSFSDDSSDFDLALKVSTTTKSGDQCTTTWWE